MLRAVMSREGWERAKRRGRFAYVGWRVVPVAVAMLAVAVVAQQRSDENWPVVVLAPLVVLLCLSHWTGIYDRTRANYRDTQAS